MDFVTIDFEASCLPRHGRSFPIEVGIAGPAETRSWLIRPNAAWRAWDWTEEAFTLHGITRAQLEEEGLEPEVVVAELRRAIGGRRVIADSGIDAYWWNTLAAATAQHAPLRIEHVGNVFDELGATTGQILSAQQRVDALYHARHRAGADARWLWALISTVRQAVEQAAEPAMALRHGDVPWRSAAHATFTRVRTDHAALGGL